MDDVANLSLLLKLNRGQKIAFLRAVQNAIMISAIIMIVLFLLEITLCRIGLT